MRLIHSESHPGTRSETRSEIHPGPQPETRSEPSAEIDLARLYAYPAGPCVRINMVASADGGSWLDGLSGGLSGRGDRKVFGVLRGLADVVLAGAATVRAEGYGPARPRESWRALRAGRPAAPPVAVVTRGLDLDLTGPLFTETAPEARTIVVTCEAAPPERRAEAARHAEVVLAGGDRVDPALAVKELAERGLTRVLCEGGPKINAQLAAAGLVDELCLTVSPLLIGGDAARVLDGPSSHTPLRLAHVLEEEGFLFLRYVRRSGPLREDGDG
ncbi:riboflavin biosynthesis pyrimidine reductase [Streptosporangium becharense]|uniref:Riboflavin biosynthesis pyrimidine reductase n=1 Tax=Streptosporangium becharense TaxID=1816182 RepID=A0A7W9IKH9_9ACTN|nr:pyrimidine reductase family protein [Streptosporangium becharense]MBB2911773.1 riboflavin biosynthesis pyrimidine reductase [Streptosporangium becharense]MBB5822409.1 riboflavin biosynthesis pyrimidine reductase [Streptosporangium becharense]